MSKQVRLQQMYDVMVEMLASGGTVNFNPRGTSMLPTLHNNGDRVVITKRDRLKKYDLPLYLRADGAFVLHRVVSVNSDGTYNMCGDNQWRIEKNVKPSQIIGVVIQLERKGKKISVENKLYKMYVVFWVNIRLLRKLCIGGPNKIKNKLKSLFRKGSI